MEKGQSFQQVVLQQLDIYMQKKKTLDTVFTLFTEINSKLIIGLM